MSRKSKGIGAERDLVHLLWEQGFAALRSPASGASRFPSPDIIAGRGDRRLAIECKITKFESQYFDKEELEQLRTFARIFGAEAWVAVRFPRQAWYFIALDDLTETKGQNYVITLDNAKEKGFILEEVIRS